MNFGMNDSLQEQVVVFENVPSFGTEWLQRQLGDLYLIVRTLASPEMYGWPCTRPRQIVYMYLKAYIYPIFRNLQVPCNIGQLEYAFNTEEVSEFIFKREVSATWQIFMVATEPEIEVDRQWARRRKLVVQRAEGENDNWQDAPDSCEACLTPKERSRLFDYIQRFPGERAYDLNQEPGKRPVLSKVDLFHTIMKNHGIVWAKPWRRWLVASDFFSIMGFPITAESQRAASWTNCQFSRPVDNNPETMYMGPDDPHGYYGPLPPPPPPAPSTRSHSSMWHQAARPPKLTNSSSA